MTLRRLIPYLLLAAGLLVAIPMGQAGAVDSGDSPMSAGSVPVYTTVGALQAPAHAAIGTCVLAAGICTVNLTGSAQFTSSASYSCIPSDQNLTATLSTISLVTGSQFKVAGLLTDTISYLCIGS